MKKYFLLILFVCTASIMNAQKVKKEITIEDIWQNYVFYPQSLGDVVHMKDGEHYCMLENEIMINEYEYKTGEKTRTIVRTS